MWWVIKTSDLATTVSLGKARVSEALDRTFDGFLPGGDRDCVRVAGGGAIVAEAKASPKQ